MSEPPAALRAVIASDNFLTREGLGCLLSDVPSIEVVARVDSHPETLDAIRQYRPDVLIVGIRTPRVNAEAALGASEVLRRLPTTRGKLRSRSGRTAASPSFTPTRHRRAPAVKPSGDSGNGTIVLLFEERCLDKRRSFRE
jgi:chemotaxis response regulator CheB